jgi:hypothetical protein
MEVISRRWYDLELLSDGNVEQRVHEGGLGDDVVPADPLHLSFSHQCQGFISNHGAPRGPELRKLNVSIPSNWY